MKAMERVLGSLPKGLKIEGHRTNMVKGIIDYEVEVAHDDEEALEMYRRALADGAGSELSPGTSPSPAAGEERKRAGS